MKKYRIPLLVITIFNIVSISLIAQEKELLVKYEYNLEGSGLLYSESSCGPTKEIKAIVYDKLLINKKFSSIRPKYDDNGNVLQKDTIYTYVVHDYNKNQLFTSFEENGLETTLLKEPFPVFEWKLCIETKDILGYSCSKAICSFRGRDYVAYFTREIPFKAAPWKFHALPGVILEVYSTDGLCSWTAQSLKIRPHLKKIKLPFEGVKPMNLKQYERFLKKMKKFRIESYKKFYMVNSDMDAEYDDAELESKLCNSIEIFDLE